jgi:hypothetical protein
LSEVGRGGVVRVAVRWVAVRRGGVGRGTVVRVAVVRVAVRRGVVGQGILVKAGGEGEALAGGVG